MITRFWTAFFSLACFLGHAQAQMLRIAGSSVANIAVSDAATLLHIRSDMQIDISTSGGSAVGIAALGSNMAQIAITSARVKQEDRARYPNVTFTEIPFGVQAVTIGVSEDVWGAGIREMTKAQLRDIYEKRITNLNQMGGPNQKISFFVSEEGRGQWELFANWVYGDARKAPLGRFPITETDEEARNSVEFTTGSLALISPLFVDGKSVYPVKLKDDDGAVYDPTLKVMATGKYPLERPLLMVVNDKPTRDIKIFADFMLGAEGQEILHKHGFLNLADVPGVTFPVPTPAPDE